MGILKEDFENAIRVAFPVIHLEIEDTSSGCGENYSVFIVSTVSLVTQHHKRSPLTPYRRSKGKQPWRDIDWVKTPRVGVGYSPLIVYSSVNEVLKKEIAMIHAFSQVCFPYSLH